MRTGRPSQRRKDVDNKHALADRETNTIFIQRALSPPACARTALEHQLTHTPRRPQTCSRCARRRLPSSPPCSARPAPCRSACATSPARSSAPCAPASRKSRRRTCSGSRAMSCTTASCSPPSCALSSRSHSARRRSTDGVSGPPAPPRPTTLSRASCLRSSGRTWARSASSCTRSRSGASLSRTRPTCSP